MALSLGGLTLAVLILWKRLHLDRPTHMPGHLPAIVIATAAAYFLQLPVKHVDVPDNLLSAIHLTGFSSLSLLIESPVILSALSLALIASAETLLSASAVDQMHQEKRARFDKELIAQGVGNMICGLVGALPMTGVIARSTVNVQSGARTRRSTIMHGFWLLLAVALLPFVLKLVPTASLAALLVYTGFKLIDTRVMKDLHQFGRHQLPIYLVTVVMIFTTDLLTGVLVGFALSLARLVLTMIDLSVKEKRNGDETVLKVKGTATFLGLPKLAESLEAVPAGSHVRIVVQDMVYIDHACLELLANFEKRHTAGGGTVTIDRARLAELSLSPADKPGSE